MKIIIKTEITIRKEWNTAVSQRETSAGFSLSLKCERRQQVAALRSRLFPPKQKGGFTPHQFLIFFFSNNSERMEYSRFPKGTLGWIFAFAQMRTSATSCRVTLSLISAKTKGDAFGIPFCFGGAVVT